MSQTDCPDTLWPAAPHGYQQSVRMGELHRFDDIRSSRTARNERRPANVECSIPDLSRVVVADGIGQQQLATEACTEVIDIQARQRDLLAIARDRIDISGN